MADALLDTTFFIDLHRGDKGAVDLWRDVFSGRVTASYSPLTLFELWWGNPGSEEENFYEGLLFFLEPAELTDDAARSAAQWLHAFPRQQAERLIRDALLAATAEGRDEAVYTRNQRDFALFPVEIRSY